MNDALTLLQLEQELEILNNKRNFLRDKLAKELSQSKIKTIDCGINGSVSLVRSRAKHLSDEHLQNLTEALAEERAEMTSVNAKAIYAHERSAFMSKLAIERLQSNCHTETLSAKIADRKLSLTIDAPMTLRLTLGSMSETLPAGELDYLLSQAKSINCSKKFTKAKTFKFIRDWKYGKYGNTELRTAFKAHLDEHIANWSNKDAS